MVLENDSVACDYRVVGCSGDAVNMPLEGARFEFRPEIFRDFS
jgi:hypothetical protein